MQNRSHDAGQAGGGKLTIDEIEAAARLGVDFVREVTDDMLEPELVGSVPVDWARANRVLPVRRGAAEYVLTCDLSRVSPLEYLGLLLGRDFAPLLADAETISDAIERCYYRREDAPGEALERLSDAGGAVSRGARPDDLLAGSQQPPITQYINRLLLEAVKRGASDIHIEPFDDQLRLRYRIDGVLYEQPAPPKSTEESLVSRIKVMAHMDLGERRLPQDGMARVRVGEREIDIRVSIVPVAEGERLVLRILDRDTAFRALGELGMPVGIRSRLESLLAVPNGMLVVCGPTGAGKTSSLYALLARIDSSRRNVLTIEDPIEYRLGHVGQVQVKPKIGLTFASGLRHLLRQDPDVLLVGEMRDTETAQIAVRASLTGHLVLSTLHTNDAVGSVVRLADMGIERCLLADCMRGALAQRLVRVLCTRCRREEPIQLERLVRLGIRADGAAGRSGWAPVGCDACLEGYRGRTGVFELMTVDERLREAIRGGEPKVLESAACAGGMRRLVDDGLDKVLAGVTSLGELAAVASTVQG